MRANVLMSFVFRLLVAAGNEHNLLFDSATIHALANDPALLGQLQRGEFARLVSRGRRDDPRRLAPCTHFRRTATRDFTFLDKQVRERRQVGAHGLSRGTATNNSDSFTLHHLDSSGANPSLGVSGQGGRTSA